MCSKLCVGLENLDNLFDIECLLYLYVDSKVNKIRYWIFFYWVDIIILRVEILVLC